MKSCYASPWPHPGRGLRFRHLPGRLLCLILVITLSGCLLPTAQPTAAPPAQTTLTPYVLTAGSQPFVTLIPTFTPTSTESPSVTERPTNTTAVPTNPLPVEPATPTRQPIPVITAEPTSEPVWNVVYQDDFEATRPWYTFTGERFIFEYKESAYYITNLIPEGLVSSLRTQKSYSNVYLEVDAVQARGPHNGYFGLICRAQDDSSYYAFVIGMDGFAGIARLIGGAVHFLTPYPRSPFRYNPQPAYNRLAARCSGNTLTLSVNGKKLVEAFDDTFSSGHVGLVVGAHIMADIEAGFDNFTISIP